MKIYQITYYVAEVHDHNHHDCGHDHEHNESCNHHHEHEHEHHHHHSNLPRKIQSLGAWANIMPNTLLVHTDMNANEIKLALDEVKQDNEFFFVSQVMEDNSGSLHPSAIDWIEKRLK